MITPAILSRMKKGSSVTNSSVGYSGLGGRLFKLGVGGLIGSCGRLCKEGCGSGSGRSGKVPNAGFGVSVG